MNSQEARFPFAQGQRLCFSGPFPEGSLQELSRLQQKWGLGLATVPIVPGGTWCLWMNHVALGPSFLPSGKDEPEMGPL